jgi:DNA-binding CsgD family transcriptional regulator
MESIKSPRMARIYRECCNDFEPLVGGCRSLNGKECKSMPTSVTRADYAPHLSKREVQVLQLICDGLQAKDIANSLGISTKTVEFHKAGIAKKIGNRSVAHMVRYAIRIGLIEP